MRSPRTRPVAPLKDHPCVSCASAAWNIFSDICIFSDITFSIKSLVRRIVDTVVLFFPSAGLKNIIKIIQLRNPFQTWMMKNFGFPLSFGQYSLLNLLGMLGLDRGSKKFNWPEYVLFQINLSAVRGNNFAGITEIMRFNWKYNCINGQNYNLPWEEMQTMAMLASLCSNESENSIILISVSFLVRFWATVTVKPSCWKRLLRQAVSAVDPNLDKNSCVSCPRTFKRISCQLWNVHVPYAFQRSMTWKCSVWCIPLFGRTRGIRQ